MRCLILLLALIAFACRADDAAPPYVTAVGEDAAELFSLHDMLAEAVAQIEANYAGPVERQALFDAALRGMVESLDPHSRYLARGEAGDYRRQVNGRDVDAAATDSVGGFLRGDGGDWRHEIDADTAYIRIAAFDDDTPREFQRALDAVGKSSAKTLVLDLRNNAGGLLPSAVDVADLLLDGGLIVTTEGRNSKRREWRAKPGLATRLPIAVVVNRYSASAAEVVAAALQDHDRAMIIGERTFGKGSVQNIIELAGGKAALKLTTAMYVRPNGKNIHRSAYADDSDAWGVQPDDGGLLEVSQDVAKRLANERREIEEGERALAPRNDRALDRAVALLKERAR